MSVATSSPDQFRDKQICILVVDDDRISRESARIMCDELFAKIISDDVDRRSVLKVDCVGSIPEAVEKLAETSYQIVLLDKDLGEKPDRSPINGIDHIKDLLAVQPFAKILMHTADLSYREIARAIKLGATDYLMKSANADVVEYRETVVKAALKESLDELKRARVENTKAAGLYANFVCSSPAMQRFEEKLLAMAEGTRPVLLLGDTGLGKGAAARRLNQLRAKHLNQKDRPFVQENIGGIPEQLVLSILFGTEPGAFTDASRKTKPGLLDLAADGDIFLDEIGDTSLETQKKILKVVEEREFMRVGGKVAIKTNARFIFATNRNLKQMVADGLFREDLYRRISAFEESVPPLEERKTDLPCIIEGFVHNVLDEYPSKRISIEDFPPDLMAYLTRDNIPGNIRGIENDVTRLIAYVPVDRNKRPNFKDWRKILGIDVLAVAKRGGSVPLDLNHLSSFESNFLSDGFPGLKEAKAIFEKKILLEAAKKYPSLSAASKALRISKAGVSVKMKAAGVRFEGDL
ncbi:MAG: sigma-54-dependent transcriptional regulator [Pseudobdellovibrionaceae bacterium]